ADLFVTNGLAQTTVLKNTGSGWTPTAITVPDPGSGPAGPAFVPDMKLVPGSGSPVPTMTAPAPSSTPHATDTTSTPRPTQTSSSPQPTTTAQGGGAGAPTARLSIDRASGVAPLTVRFDARASSDAENDPLSFAWDFG